MYGVCTHARVRIKGPKEARESQHEEAEKSSNQQCGNPSRGWRSDAGYCCKRESREGGKLFKRPSMQVRCPAATVKARACDGLRARLQLGLESLLNADAPCSVCACVCVCVCVRVRVC